MHYKISEIAHMLGITPQSIRFYEKYGISPGSVNAENGYRTYDLGSIYTLLNCRQYQNCGFTVAETSQMLSCQEPEAIRRSYEEKEAELERSIALEQRILRRMRELSRQLSTAQDNVGQMVTVTNPDFAAVLYSFRHRESRIPQSAARTISSWGRYMPLAGIMLYFAGYALEHPAKLRHSGFLMEREDAAFLGLDREAGVFSLPPRKCLYTIVSGRAQNGPVAEDFSQVFEQLRVRGVVPAAPPFSRGIVSLDRLGAQQYLTELWIPLEPMDVPPLPDISGT